MYTFFAIRQLFLLLSCCHFVFVIHLKLELATHFLARSRFQKIIFHLRHLLKSADICDHMQNMNM